MLICTDEPFGQYLLKPSILLEAGRFDSYFPVFSFRCVKDPQGTILPSLLPPPPISAHVSYSPAENSTWKL